MILTPGVNIIQLFFITDTLHKSATTYVLDKPFQSSLNLSRLLTGSNLTLLNYTRLIETAGNKYLWLNVLSIGEN